jgi:hypothetical protein
VILHSSENSPLGVSIIIEQADDGPELPLIVPTARTFEAF